MIQGIADFVPEIGYRMAQLDFSPITGPEGNIEYITELLPGIGEAVSEEHITSIVEAAHRTLAK